MDIKELRIGNNVMIGGIITKIEGLSTWDDIIQNSNFSERPLSEFEPIPLTEEILLKCGFKKDGRYLILKLEEYCNLFYDTTDKTICIGVEYEAGGTERKFEYVHQLQNLVFALTGEELLNYEC
jgi:hypothetical protein